MSRHRRWSLRITVNRAAENRDIADNPYTSIQPRVTTKNAQGDKVWLQFMGLHYLGITQSYTHVGRNINVSPKATGCFTSHRVVK